MKNVGRMLSLVIVAGLLVAVTGCSRRCVRPDEPIPPPPPGRLISEMTDEAIDPAGELDLATIYFDLDESVIRAGEERKLEENARKLKNATATGQVSSVTIEGHCCPIGTDAHNMALGLNRANAVRNFLVRMGVPANQLSVISYGSKRLVTEDPARYSKNRRVEFKLHN